MFHVVPDRIDALRPFFPHPPPNAPMLEAFFDQRAPGRAFVDDFRAPRACIVAMNYSFVFLGGRVSREFFDRAIGVLRREYDVHVVWPAGRAPSRWTPPDETTRRIEYAGRQTADSAGLRALKEPAAAGEIRRIDAALLRRCRWRDEVVRATGSAREFLGHGIGFCLLVDGTVVSEAYACFWGRERLEIATITHPEHRGRGYAGAVCAHLIESCEGLGFATYWSCDAANRASCKLASKLGFADPQRYRLLVYRQRTAR